MGKRVEWLKLVMRHSRPKTRPHQLLIFLTFETYYGLCKLRGYQPRHFLDPVPAEIKGCRAGDRYIVVFPILPFSIRLLNRIFPFGSSHAEFMPYTDEVAEKIKASGRRAEVGVIQPGVFRAGNRC